MTTEEALEPPGMDRLTISARDGVLHFRRVVAQDGGACFAETGVSDDMLLQARNPGGVRAIQSTVRHCLMVPTLDYVLGLYPNDEQVEIIDRAVWARREYLEGLCESG